MEELLRSRGCSLSNWPAMPYPDNRYITEFSNQLIYDETDYNPVELQTEYERLYASLTTEQKGVYDTIVNSVETGTSDIKVLNKLSLNDSLGFHNWYQSLVALDLGSTRYVSAAYVHVSAVNEDNIVITASLIKVVSVAQIVYAANMKVNTGRA
ncbi:hypothetical protein Tco_0178418 [Tanacetum coccineum]